MPNTCVRYRTDDNYPGIVRVDIAGLVTDASLQRFWDVLSSPIGAASLVSVFDFRRSVVAYRSPPRMVEGAPQQKPGAFLCNLGQYEVLLRRSAQLSSLGVRRAVFCSEALALEWAAEEAIAHRRQNRESA